jgi:YVTN family beta-propeller protein
MLLCRILCSAAVVACCAAPAFSDQPPTLYRTTKVVPLGPGDQWDLLTFDPTSKVIYVAHGDHVTVVDERKAAVVGQIGTFAGGTHGVAISRATHHGYTDDGKAGVAIAFDLKSLKPLNRISAAPDADAIIDEPVTGRIYVINGDSGSLTAIDPKTDTAVSTISVGAGLEIGLADGRGALFINGVEKHEIVKIDAKTNKVVAHWAMPDCQKPHGLALDPKTRRLFSTCANNVLVVVDADNGANVAAVPIGGFSDGAAFDPERKRVFSSNGDGTLSVVEEQQDGGRFVPLGTVQTLPGARTMTIDPETGRLFLVAADIAKTEPPMTAGGRPRITFVPNSVKLLFLDPVN